MLVWDCTHIVMWSVTVGQRGQESILCIRTKSAASYHTATTNSSNLIVAFLNPHIQGIVLLSNLNNIIGHLYNMWRNKKGPLVSVQVLSTPINYCGLFLCSPSPGSLAANTQAANENISCKVWHDFPYWRLDEPFTKYQNCFSDWLIKMS